MITSTHNKRVAQASRLKKRAMREHHRRFLVEGVQGVVEAFTAKAPVEEVFMDPAAGDRVGEVGRLAEQAGAPVWPVSTEVMAHLTSTVTPQGVVAVAGFVDMGLDELRTGAGCVPVLVEVRDPGNAGTILRSADATGADAVVFTTSSVDVYNQKTVRATAGSLFHVPVVRESGVEESVARLRELGYAVLAADAAGRTPIQEADLSVPLAVLLGNEARGLSPYMAELADDTVRIPIHGRAESLNLAAAATLIMFEAARRREGDDPSAGPPGNVLAQVVAGAAHDIRSPLTAMKGFSGTLLSKWERLSNDQRLMMLEGIAQDASRMELIVAGLVDAARLSSDRLQLSVEPTDLLGAARRVHDEIEAWGSVDVDVSGQPVKAFVDPARMRTILSALIEGAHWWGDVGPVRVEVKGEPVPTIDVYRQGTGLAQAEAMALFGPRPPSAGGGSKVGLFVAKGLAEAHGGTLDVQTDGGIRFTVSLPPAS